MKHRELVKTKFKPIRFGGDYSRARVSQCLEALGLMGEERKSVNGMFKGCPKSYRPLRRECGFWGQDEWTLRDILKAARTAFKKIIKEVHPRTEHEKNYVVARAIISAWTQLKNLFERHGITLDNN